jgi:methyl-accepting chemotaxis protein
MPRKESKVTKNVRESVVRAASEIERLKAKFNNTSAPIKTKIGKAKEIVKEISRKSDEMRAEAKNLSRKAVKTTRDAIKGFKQGMKIVRQSKKPGKA